MKQESQTRLPGRLPPVRSVTSSTVVQKQVGQTAVQLLQARQREATSSQRGLSAPAYSSSLMPVGVQRAAHPSRWPPRRPGRRRRGRRPSPCAAPISSRTSAPCRLTDLDDEPVRPAVEQLGEGQVVGRAAARPGSRPGVHGDAEAGAARVRARDRDDERGRRAGRRSAASVEAAVEQHGVVDADGGRGRRTGRRAGRRAVRALGLGPGSRVKPSCVAPTAPQHLLGGEEDRLGGLGAGGEAEDAVVVAAAQPVVRRRPARRPSPPAGRPPRDRGVHDGALRTVGSQTV